MKLSTRARYGMRAMVAIARRADAYSTGEQIAHEEDVSKKYLDSILGELREAGLLDAARGAKGGYKLARPAAEMTAAEIVESLDGPISIVPCVRDADSCQRSPRCPTRHVWQSVSEAARQVLAGLTLAQLVCDAPGNAPPPKRRPTRPSGKAASSSGRGK